MSLTTETIQEAFRICRNLGGRTNLTRVKPSPKRTVRDYLKPTSFAHYFAGIVTVVVALSWPVISVLLFVGFIIYELNEDWYLEDEAFHDIREYLVGLVGTSVFLVLRAWQLLS